MRRLVIDADLSRRLGQCGLSRNPLLRLLVGLRTDLEDRYQIFKGARHPDRPDFFLFNTALVDGDELHLFQFLIDDSATADHLFVEAFQHSKRPRPGK
jgi:hypothetical protein